MITLSALVCNFLSRSGSASLRGGCLSQTQQRANMAGVDENSNKPTVLFVLGGPGAGKGTQCGNLVKDYDFEHLSAGDLLRAERNSGSKDGDLIQSYIKEGRIVPIEITIRLIEKAMDDSPKKKFLIDGFPRNKDNLEGWNNTMSDKTNVMGVLYFDCPENVCIKRIMKRGETSGRADDNEESLKKRFRTFYNDTMPIITYFKEKGLVMNISAVPEPSEVYESVKAVLNSK